MHQAAISSTLKSFRHEGVTLFSSVDFSAQSLKAIFSTMRQPPHRAREVLGGRGNVAFIDLAELGSVAVKPYCRGGLLRHLVRERYLNLGPTRPAAEFEMLRHVRASGIAAPIPVGYALEGGLFYRGWLLTREIPQHSSLAEVAQRSIGTIGPVIGDLVRQVALLIGERVLHIDLHPGNVLVSGEGEVFLIDFDKARQVSITARELRDAYIFRWRRAVIKHRLPEQLSEHFCLGLRQSSVTEPIPAHSVAR